MSDDIQGIIGFVVGLLLGFGAMLLGALCAKWMSWILDDD